MTKGTVVIAGATNSLGKALAQHYVERGHRVVVSSRTMERAAELAKELGGDSVPVAFDMAEPHSIAPALADVDDVIPRGNAGEGAHTDHHEGAQGSEHRYSVPVDPPEHQVCLPSATEPLGGLYGYTE